MLYFETQADKAGRVMTSTGEIKTITHKEVDTTKIYNASMILQDNGITKFELI